MAVTLEPKHLAAWKRANELTRPGSHEKPPTYGAWHRKRAERKVEAVEAEADAPKLEGLGSE